MSFLAILAEAVNAVAEWPQEQAWVADDPMSRSIGYQVADVRWTCKIRDLKVEGPNIQFKCGHELEPVKFV